MNPKEKVEEVKIFLQQIVRSIRHAGGEIDLSKLEFRKLHPEHPACHRYLITTIRRCARGFIDVDVGGKFYGVFFFWDYPLLEYVAYHGVRLRHRPMTPKEVHLFTIDDDLYITTLPLKKFS